MLDLIWGLFQQAGTKQADFVNKLQDEKLKGQRSETDRLALQLRELEKRHEQLKLVTLAMWSLLRDHSGLLEADLRKYVEEIDLLDGKRDGKTTPKKDRVSCDSCERTILATARVCPYCGAYTKAKPFDTA